MIRLLRGIDRGACALALGAACALLAAMAAVSFWQVVTRFALERPSTWSEVAARAMQVWMVYLGAVAAFRAGALMSVDLALRVAPPALRLALTLLIAAACLGTLGVMAWAGWDMAARVRTQTLAGVSNPFTGGTISIAWIYAAVPVGGALAIVAVLARLGEDLGAIRAGARPAPALEG